MMITHLRDLLISYWRKHASNQIKQKKTKLLIYDEYLNKYVSAEELLIPGVKVKNKGAVTNTKSKELFVFDVLFKKFVNPKLDLLVPGVKSLDVLFKNSVYNKQENTKTSSRDYFWGKKTSKKHAVFPLPPVHSKTCTETEPPQLGWAGQKTRKPDTDPRPELGQPECMLGPPGKDPKKKKPRKKKGKKKKLIVCSKVKKQKKSIKGGINKRDTAETTKDSSTVSKGIINIEDNCYSASKVSVKQLKLQGPTNNRQETPLKSVVKKEALLENVIKTSEKNKANKSEGFKIICSKLFSKEENVKEPTTVGSTSDRPTQMNVCDPKANTPIVRHEKDNKNTLNESNDNKKVTNQEKDCSAKESKALLCKPKLSSNFIPTKDSKTVTSIYLCKEPNNKSKNKKQLIKIESSVSKMVYLPGTPSRNEVKCDKIKPCNFTKEDEGKDRIGTTSTCFSKAKDNNICCKNKIIKDSSLDQAKNECKQSMVNRLNSPQVETPCSSTAITNEIKCDKIELFKCTKDDAGVGNITNTSTSCNKGKIDDCNKCKSIKDSGMDQVDREYKNAIMSRPSTSLITTSDSSKVDDCSNAFKNTKSNLGESKILPCNFIQKPKTTDLQKTCPKTSSLLAPVCACNSTEQNVLQANDKSGHSNEKPKKCPKAEKSKTNDKCREVNDQEPLECNSSKCLNIDSKSTEKLQRITQEELFKIAESSPDLTKCSSYLGFKVKKPCSKAKPTEISLKAHTGSCKKTTLKKVNSKTKNKSKTALKCVKSQDESIQSKADCNSLTVSKSDMGLKEDHTKQMLNNTSQDLKDLSTKSTCRDNVSFCDNKVKKSKSKSKSGRSSDSKCDSKDRKNKLSHKKSSTKTAKKCKSKSTLNVGADNLKSQKEIRKKKSTCKKEHNNKLPTEKSIDCTTPSAGSQYKGKTEISNYDTVKGGNSCKKTTNQTPHGQDEQVCCKKPQKEIENGCSEKSPIKETVQCPPVQEKTKQTATDKNKLRKRDENTKNNKSKDYLKHIITGATQRKRTNLCKICKSVTSLQSVKSQSISNKVISSFPKKLEKNEEPLNKIKRGKSAKSCSEKKSNIGLDKNSKKSKSKQSVCPKIDKDKNLEHTKQKIKPQTEDKLTKLNKFVRREKCRTASRISKAKKDTTAVICSKSTPNIHPAKGNNISGLTKPNVAGSKRPSTSNTPDSNFKNIKGSKNEMKNSQRCSLHTLHKRMTEIPTKTTKGTDVKTFSEHKTITSTPQKNSSDDNFNIRNYSSKLDLQSNKQKTGKMDIKSTVFTEENKLEKDSGQKTRRNSLKINDWWNHAFIDSKNKQTSPDVRNEKHVRLLLTSMTKDTEANKHKPKEILTLSTSTNKSDPFTLEKQIQANMVTKSPNNIKEYSNNRLKIWQDKNKCQISTTLLVPLSKDRTNNADKSSNVINTNSKLNMKTKDTKLNEKEISNSIKTTNKGVKENDKRKGGKLISGERIASLLKEVAKETYFNGRFRKGDGSKNQLQQETRSNTQLKVVGTPNTDIKSIKNRVCTSAAPNKSSANNALSAAHQTLSPCKTKSFSSFNTLQLQNAVAKNAVRPFGSPKKETNKELEIKTISDNKQEQKTIKAEMQCFQKDKISDRIQLPLTKNETTNKSSVNKISKTPDNRCFDHELLVPRKLQHLKVNEQKSVTELSKSTGQNNVGGDFVCNSKILCDFIEGSSDVNVQDIEPLYSDINSNYFTNPHGQMKNLNKENGFQKAEQKNKTTQLVNVGKHYLNYKGKNKIETSPATGSTWRNKRLIIDELEKHVSKLENIVPSMKRIFKPIYLNNKVSVIKNQESNKIYLAGNTPVKDKTIEGKINKQSETVSKPAKENNNIRQTKGGVLNESAFDRTIINNVNNVITPINTGKRQETTVKKCLNTILGSDLQNGKIENQIVLRPVTSTKALINSKYSPRLKTKMQLISKRHKKFTNFKHKKTPSIAKKLDIGHYKKPEAKEPTYSSMSNENNNREQRENKPYINVVPSLSSKQSRLLTEQPFYMKQKPEPPLQSVLHMSKSESSLVGFQIDNTKGTPSSKPPAIKLRSSIEQPINEQFKSTTSTDRVLNKSKSDSSFDSNKDNAKCISSYKLPARQLRSLMEQPFYKQQKPQPYTENSLFNSKSQNILPKSNHISRNELHSSKSESTLVARSKNKAIPISPRKQQTSIRSRLQRKTPTKAVVQANPNKTDKD